MQDKYSVLCVCVTPQLMFSLRWGLWPSESGMARVWGGGGAETTAILLITLEFMALGAWKWQSGGGGGGEYYGCVSDERAESNYKWGTIPHFCFKMLSCGESSSSGDVLRGSRPPGESSSRGVVLRGESSCRGVVRWESSPGELSSGGVVLEPNITISMTECHHFYNILTLQSMGKWVW